jgi:hypothetical protein
MRTFAGQVDQNQTQMLSFWQGNLLWSVAMTSEGTVLTCNTMDINFVLEFSIISRGSGQFYEGNIDSIRKSLISSTFPMLCLYDYHAEIFAFAIKPKGIVSSHDLLNSSWWSCSRSYREHSMCFMSKIEMRLIPLWSQHYITGEMYFRVLKTLRESS